MKLKRRISGLDLFSIAIGSMISAGIFILPGIAFIKVGPAVIISYGIAGICVLIGALSMIELSTAMPKAGGNYYFISRSLGPLIGTTTGFLIWFAISLKCAFAIFGLSFLITHYFTGLNMYFVSVTLTLAFVIINMFGTEKAAKLEMIMIFILLPLIILFIVLGFNLIDVTHFSPFLKQRTGFNDIIATAAFVFVSFGGLANVSGICGEISNPKKNIPLALISSILVVGILYTLVLFISIGVMPANQLAHSLTPVQDAAMITGGTTEFYILTIAAILAFLTTANAGIMTASRYPLALSRDKFVPLLLGKINKRFNTPVISLVLTGIFIAIALLMDLETLAEVASTVLLAMYILINLAVIVLRMSKIQNYRPTFTTPFYPWTQLISIILFIFLLCYMELHAIMIGLALVLSSMIFYFLYAKKTTSKYALLHLIEDLTNKKLTSIHLEKELKDIIHERDNITKDDFDNLIENAPTMDIEGPLKLNDFFHIITEELQNHVKGDKDKLLQLFIEREESSSTVLLPSIAIPHIVVEEDDCFTILLARCSKGIKFSEEHQDVKAVVALIGSKNKRNLHLRTLVAIAQIIQSKNFDSDWRKASSLHNLKDIFLLAERRRVN